MTIIMAVRQNSAMLRITNHTKPVKVGEKLLEDLENIMIERVKKGIDRKMRSLREMIDLIPHHSAWESIKKDMLAFKFPERKT